MIIKPPPPKALSRNLPRSIKAALAAPFLLVLTLVSPVYGQQQIDIKPQVWQEPITGMAFVKISGDCFIMGQSEQESKELIEEAGVGIYEKFYADELPRHKVCVDDFWLGRYEVTNKQWHKVLGNLSQKTAIADNLPVQKVSYEMAEDFSQRLTNMAKGKSFRLPSEAEWEFAARAGSGSAFSFGDIADSTLANYNGTFIYGRGKASEYRRGPMPVGSFAANAFGLHDMHGNMWEWCADWYGVSYQNSPTNNPPGPATGSLRVMRGGSWFVAPRSMRSANRNGVKPDKAVNDFGLRLVVTFSKQAPILSDFDQDF